MNICELCGSNEFEEIFGMNYCKLCNTLSQSQGIGQEATIDNINYHGSQLIKLANPFTSQETKKRDIQVDDYRPWKTLEGFQLVLKEQVENLISLGFQPELKEIVFKIWTSYLKYTHQAFVPNSKKEYLKERLRDKYISKSSENFYITKCKIKAWIDKHQRNKLKKQMENENMPNDEEISFKSDDNLDDNNELDIINNDISNNIKMNIKSENIDNNVIKSVTSEIMSETASITKNNYEDNLKIIDKEIDNSLSKEVQFSLFKMSLPLTLSILHASLLYFDSNVLAHDLVRLVKTNKMAYNDHNWPDDMLINTSDFITFFQKNIPTPEQVTYNTYRIFKLLNLSLIENPSFEDITLRLLLKLHLPAQILHVIHNILLKLGISKANINSNFYFNILKLDVGTFSIALIVVSLKIIFLLNDHYENIISDCSDKLMNLLLLDKTLFNWNYWKLYTSKRIRNPSVQNIIELESVSSTRDLLDMYSNKPKLKINSKNASNKNQKQQKNVNLFKSFQEMLKDENENSDIDLDSEKEKSATGNFEEVKLKMDINPFKNHEILYALNGKQFILQSNTNLNIPRNIIFHLECNKIYRRRPMTKLRSLRNADIKYRNNLNQFEQIESFKWVKSRHNKKSTIKLNSNKNMKHFDFNKNLKNLNGSNVLNRKNAQHELFFNSSGGDDYKFPYSDKNYKKRNNRNMLSSINKEKICDPYRKKLKYARKIQYSIYDFKSNRSRNGDSSSYKWLLYACGKILDCSQLVVDSYVQRIEKKLFDFGLISNKVTIKESVCKNIFFPKGKIVHKKGRLSFSNLKNLLKKNN